MNLLQTLLKVSPAVSSSPNLPQDHCFIFSDGMVGAFNGEIAMRIACDVKSKKGKGECAVPAKPLLDALSKIRQTELETKIKKKSLEITGDGIEATHTIENEITNPLSRIPQPESWEPMPSGMANAIVAAASCTDKNANAMELRCVMISAKHVDGCTPFQVIRFNIASEKSAMILGTSAAHVGAATHWGLSDSWLHFKDADGLEISVRTHEGDYPRTDGILDQEAKIKVKLPHKLLEMSKLAGIYDDSDSPVVRVQFGNGKLHVRGAGACGKIDLEFDIEYDEQPLQFHISVDLIERLLAKGAHAKMGDGQLRISDDVFTYVTCLESDDD